jgi:hypothetical protein
MMTARDDESQELSCRVRFFRTIVNNRGIPFECTIDSIAIRRARTRQRALAAAMRRFERKYRLAAWNHIAHGYESEDLAQGSPPDSSKSRLP